MSHREGGHLNLSTLPLVGRQREQQGIMGQRSHPYTLCNVLPQLCSATTDPVAKVTRLLKSARCTKWKPVTCKAWGLSETYFVLLVKKLKKTVIEIGEENQSDVLDYCYTCSWLAEIITTGFTIAALSDVIEACWEALHANPGWRNCLKSTS